MTEAELRAKVAETAEKFIGVIKGSVRHKEIIQIYNDGAKPLPRGYKMTTNDAWCACFVSSVSIQCGMTDIMPLECSCGQMVKLYQKLGRWVENDAYRPQIGDVLFYFWNDPSNYKTTDQTGSPNHVGIVVETDGDAFTVVEGNRTISGVSQVAYRTMQVNGRYIRGYGIPDYASKRDRPWYEASMDRAKELGLMDGTRPMDNVTRAEAATIALRLYDLLS